MLLVVNATPEGWTFRLDSPAPIPVESWALHTVRLASGGSANLAPLFEMLAIGQARVRDEIELVAQHAAISSLSGTRAATLGLPPVMPYRLRIEGRGGALASPGFRFAYRYEDSSGKPLATHERVGCLLRAAGKSFRVPEPLLGMIDGMDAFNANPPADLEERFLAWARIRGEADGDGVQSGPLIADKSLAGMKIVLLDSFTLHPKSGNTGGLQFDVIPGRRSESGEWSRPLPPGVEQDFTTDLLNFAEPRTRYALPNQWYIVLTPELRTALRPVQRAIRTGFAQRLELLRNPRAVVRAALAEGISEEELESLFEEAMEFSDRVTGLGLWTQPVLPWVAIPKQSWLPPEEFGVLIGDELVRIAARDGKDVIQRVEKAISTGEPVVTYEGQRIPAHPDALAALTDAYKAVSGEGGNDGGREDGVGNAHDDFSGDDPPGKTVLLIRTNHEEKEYGAPARKPRSADAAWFPPAALRATLLAHQTEGCRWLAARWAAGFRGALLADDMGLGKTLQVLAFLGWLRDRPVENKRKPFLIVAPTGLLANWRAEHLRHFEEPGIGIIRDVFGVKLKELRVSAASEIESLAPVLNAGTLQNSDAVLTTYETLRDYQKSFGMVSWEAVVFDEAQKIKNPAALATHAAKALKAEFVITMTGTPVENRLADLWSIVDTAEPGILGALKEFSAEYEGREVNEERARERADRLRGKLEDRTAPMIMLRRMKEDHLDGLPEKEHHIEHLSMPSGQAAAYSACVAEARGGDRESKKHIFQVIQKLRSISLHPGDVEPESGEAFIAASARMRRCFEILEDVRKKGEKALVFVESLDVQAAVATLIQPRFGLELPPFLINGEVAGTARQKRVVEFQGRQGFDVMVLTPKSGGVGLTLTAANHVIHLSRPWNPAVEDQCSDRVYRIGQKRKVHIHYPIAEHPEFGNDSFDHRLHRLLEWKRQLSRSVLQPTVETEDDYKSVFEDVIGGR